MAAQPKAWTLGLLVFLFAFGIRIANLDHEPITDELYHILAGTSWVETGSFAVADGEYHRARLFSILTGATLEWADGRLIYARLVGVFFGSLLALFVYYLTATRVDRLAGLIAGGIVAILPGAVFLSQYIRMYSLHALTFWGAAVCLYLCLTSRKSVTKRLPLVVSAAILLVLSIHLQLITMIGIAGLTVWLLLANTDRLLGWFGERGRVTKAIVVLGGLLATAVSVALLFGPFAFLLDAYASSALWSAGGYPLYYVRFYMDQLGVFWSLFPAAILLAAWRAPGLTLFAGSIFVAVVVLQSFGGMQAERFVFYSLPYFAVIWGAAGSTLLHSLGSSIERGFRSMRTSPALNHAISVVTLAFIVAWAVLSTPAVELTTKMALGRPVRISGGDLQYWSVYDQTSWEGASADLESLVEVSDVFVTSQGLQAIYHLGDFDIELNATQLGDLFGESDIDTRTGRLVIASLDSLRTVYECHRSGVLVIHAAGWRNPIVVIDEVADFIETEMERLNRFQQWGMHVFRWEREVNGGGLPAGGCELFSADL